MLVFSDINEIRRPKAPLIPSPVLKPPPVDTFTHIYLVENVDQSADTASNLDFMIVLEHAT